MSGGLKNKKDGLTIIREENKINKAEGASSSLDVHLSESHKFAEAPLSSPPRLLEGYSRFFCNRCNTFYLVAEEDLEAKPCPFCDYGYWKEPIPLEELEELFFGDSK